MENADICHQQFLSYATVYIKQLFPRKRLEIWGPTTTKVLCEPRRIIREPSGSSTELAFMLDEGEQTGAGPNWNTRYLLRDNQRASVFVVS